MTMTATARAALPVTNRLAYLNTAGMGPVSTVYAATLAAATDKDVGNGRAIAERYEAIETATERLRSELALLLGTDAQSIRLTRSTSAGIDAAIAAIAWQRGDEVIVTDAEHEACTVAVQRLADRHGIIVRVATLPTSSGDDIGWLEEQITPATRLIAVSAVTFETGARLPIGRIAELARARGVLTLIDGAQCAGAAPVEPARWDADFCAIPLQKWLCGPEGLGALYVRPALLPELARPPLDEVTHGRAVLEAAVAQLEWLREQLGWPAILEHTAALADYARSAVSAIAGAEVLTPSSHAGIVTVRCGAATGDDAGRQLAERGFLIRHLSALRAFRISTAHFNTAPEIDGLVDAINALDENA